MSFETAAFSVFGVVLGLLGLTGIAAAAGNAGALRLLHGAVHVEPTEVRPMLVACLYFFCTLASYFILRPIRDAMAVASGARNLPWLFTATLSAMILFHPVYSSLVARFPVKKFVALTYAFFAANLVAFFFVWKSGVSELWTGRVFYVWTSVFNLFVISVFWSVMVDTFRTAQAKRLFGFIAVGGTIGSVTGSAITAFFVDEIGTTNLLLVSVCLLLAAAALVANFPRVPHVDDGTAGAPVVDHQQQLIGGSVLAGVLSIFRSRYIAGIAVFLVLYTVGSTLLYSSQTDIIGRFYTDRDTQTLVLARMELATQVIAALGQAFLTARIIRVAGLSVTLAVVPVISMLGFAALGATAWGITPLLGTFIAFNVLRRSSEFMLGNPSRKILFTVLNREDKYKASSFVETSVYRLGDQIGVWGFRGLTGAGLLLTGVSWVAVPLSALFMVMGIWLGRRQRELAAAAGAG